MSQMTLPNMDALLHIPHLSVQNANAISGPHSWGHPSPTHFTGLMTALERKLGSHGLYFMAVGVVNHGYQTQINGDYVRRFNLSRNPICKDGSTAAIVEEGRIHLQLSLVFGLQLSPELREASDETLNEWAMKILQILQTLRVAGGSVLPNHSRLQPRLIRLSDSVEDNQKIFRNKLRHYLLPGYALVARDDLLSSHHAELQANHPEATRLDAWLNLSRLNHFPVTDEKTGKTEWRNSRQAKRGWIVPLPVGYGAISELYEAGKVANCRDETTPVRFVESLYSLGEWLSPHRLTDYRQLLWYPTHDPERGVYRCCNDYAVKPE